MFRPDPLVVFRAKVKLGAKIALLKGCTVQRMDTQKMYRTKDTQMMQHTVYDASFK